MKQTIPKWRLQKVEVIREGVIDQEFSGYELQKNGMVICKLSLDSLKEVREIFNQLLDGNN